MILSFQGKPRAGKTYSATLYAAIFQECRPQPIYANYNLKLPNFHRFEKWRELENVYNSIIVVDEIMTMFDSRNYASTDQIYFTHLSMQLGKRGNTFIYTTQRFNAVEKRIRENTDFIVECYKKPPSQEIYQDWYDAQRNVDQPTFIDTKIITKPEVFYGLYNSFEIVKSKIKIYEKKPR